MSLDRSSCPSCLAVFRGGFARCPHDGEPLQQIDKDPLVGAVLAERYTIESVIGEGGIGRVYRARHVRMSRRYAIKVPFGELAYDAKVRTRFMHEAEATARLQHPNIVGVVDVGETSAGLLYMAMDLAEGISLGDVIHREGPLAPGRIRRIVEQIADGLGHAHERGLVHRDLKPENIILERDPGGDERVRLVDFGIAILRDQDGTPTSGRLTTEGIVLGTPHYMSPEQACNQPIDHRTDLFALGLILYEMLAGVLPFDGNPVEVARKNLGADPPRITRRVPGLVVDRFLQALAFWLMEKKPESRPQRAVEVVELVRLMESDPSAAAARLRIGEVEEVTDLPAPVDDQGLKPVRGPGEARGKGKLPVRPRPPLPEKTPRAQTPLPLATPPRAEKLIKTDTERTLEAGFDDPTHIDNELPAFAEVDYEPRLSEGLALERRRRQRVAVVAIGVAVALAAILIFIVTRRGPDDAAARAPLPPDASPWKPLSSIDAEIPGVDPPVDAGVAVVEAVEAVVIDAAPAPPDAAVGTAVATGAGTGTATRKKNGDGRKKPDRTAKTTPDAAVAKVAPPEDSAPTTASLRKLYEEVGGQLNQLIKSKGAEVASAFRRRYEQIPYLEATRKPALREDAMTRLRALSRDLKAALRG